MAKILFLFWKKSIKSKRWFFFYVWRHFEKSIWVKGQDMMKIIFEHVSFLNSKYLFQNVFQRKKKFFDCTWLLFKKIFTKTISNVFFFEQRKLKVFWKLSNSWKCRWKKKHWFLLFFFEKSYKSKRWNLYIFTLKDILKNYLELRNETWWKMMVYIRGSF